MTEVTNALLEMLDPEVITKKIDDPHDKMLSSYKCETMVPGSFTGFEQMLGDYYQYHCAAVLSVEHPLPEELARASARQVVEEAFAHEGDRLGLRECSRPEERWNQHVVQGDSPLSQKNPSRKLRTLGHRHAHRPA